jgi:hypothetical protein
VKNVACVVDIHLIDWLSEVCIVCMDLYECSDDHAEECAFATVVGACMLCMYVL